jgi:hypothetical protein
MRVLNSLLLVLALVASARIAGAQQSSPQSIGHQGPTAADLPQGPPPGQPAVLVRPQPTPQPQPGGAPPPGQPPQPGLPTPPSGPPLPKRLVNIQVELTITDQLGTGAPEKKTVSMIAADGTWGRIRAGANARPSERTGMVSSSINIDARPFLAPNQNDLIQVELTIEYRPLRTLTAGDPTQVEPTNLNQSMSVILANGRPMQISQAADPITDRKILVEVKATVMK